MAEFPRTAGRARVVVLETVGSTNAEALSRAAAGERGPLWVVARMQSAGRGRRGRTWVSERGNLYATLLLCDAAPPAVVSGICFVAALALHDALLDAVHGLAPAQLKLKWPNDLLLCGGKIAGILVEGASYPDGNATAVGIGVNCAHSPEGTEFPANSLAAAGFSMAPEALLALLGTAMDRRLDEWARGANFASVRSAWLARASGIGAAIEVRLASRSISGTFEALDDGGALILRQSDGTKETIAAGDVFPLAG
jgi:BirA family transcriptional regulator, biotin operon repressor / biotin---[acetyl-CoA-carboxylase] ligase